MEPLSPVLILLHLSSTSDKVDFYIFEGVFFLSFFLLSQAFSFSFLCSCCCLVSFLCPFCFLNVDFFPWRFCLANKLLSRNTPWVISFSPIILTSSSNKSMIHRSQCSAEPLFLVYKAALLNTSPWKSYRHIKVNTSKTEKDVSSPSPCEIVSYISK